MLKSLLFVQARKKNCELDDEDRQEFLEALGIEESGLDQLIREAYDLLGLATYFTAVKKKCVLGPLKKG